MHDMRQLVVDGSQFAAHCLPVTLLLAMFTLKGIRVTEQDAVIVEYFVVILRLIPSK